MRMWMVDPRIMCKNHLLGEHKEIHMILGSITLGINLGRYLSNQMVDPSKIKERHDALVDECDRRGWPSGLLHETPIEEEDLEGLVLVVNPVDVETNLEDLLARCDLCWRKWHDRQASCG